MVTSTTIITDIATVTTDTHNSEPKTWRDHLPVHPAVLPTSQLSVVTLCETIKALVSKGDQALEKAEQFYIAAGKHLIELQTRCQNWEALAKQSIGIGRSRAYEYMALADGRKSLADLRGEQNKRQKQKTKRDAARSSVTHGQSNAVPVTSRKNRPTNPALLACGGLAQYWSEATPEQRSSFINAVGLEAIFAAAPRNLKELFLTKFYPAPAPVIEQPEPGLHTPDDLSIPPCLDRRVLA